MFDFNQTLFVGIDVSKDSNQVCLINFERKILLNKPFKNNLEGASEMKTTIISNLSKHNFSNLIIVLESTATTSCAQCDAKNAIPIPYRHWLLQ